MIAYSAEPGRPRFFGRGAALALLILIICGLVASCASKGTAPPVSEGRAVYGGNGTALRLDGSWDFLSGEGGTKSAEVPGVWNSFLDWNGSGTYRLKLDGLSPGTLYAFRFGGISSRAEITVDGERLGNWGDSGIEIVPKTFWFVATGNSATLTVEVENSLLAEGGLWVPVLFGPAQAVSAAAQRTQLISAAVLGSILMMGLYHLALFTFRTRARSALFFGLFCLLVFVKAGFSNEQLLAFFFARLNSSGGLRAAYAATILMPPVFVPYLEAMFPRIRSRFLLRGLCVVGALYAVLAVVLPLRFLQAWFLPYQALIIAVAVYEAVRLVSECRRGSTGAGIILFGFLLLVASVVNDVLYDNRLIDTFYSLELGLSFFLFCQAAVLGKLFSRTFRQVQELNATLELRVSERTKELETLTRIDPLTGLMNRRHFRTMLEEAWNRWVQYGQDFSVVMLDLDLFKEINDTLGHAAGDEALKALSRVLLENMRKTDCVGRYGGEEFCLIMPGAGVQEAGEVMEKIRGIMAVRPVVTDPEPVFKTFSYGVALASNHRDPDCLINSADTLMYRAKQEGRNRGVLEPEPA